MRIASHERLIKNYFLWPFLAIISTIAIYLVLVYYLYKGLLLFSFTEDFIWNNFTKSNLRIIDDKRGIQIQRIIDRLPATLLPHNYKKIHIIIIDNSDLNAFAAPGGRVVITKGLLDNIDQEPALLFVIGHEIAHLCKQDHLKELAKVIVAKLYKFITFSDIFADLISLTYNYKNQQSEFAADHKAFEIVYFLYKRYDGIMELFDKLSIKSNINQIVSPYLLTHPDTEDRKKKILLLINSKMLTS